MQTTINTAWSESCRPITSPLPKCLRVPWAWLSPYMPQQMLVIQHQARTPACFLRHFDQNVVNWTFRYSWIGRSLRNWAFWYPNVIIASRGAPWRQELSAHNAVVKGRCALDAPFRTFNTCVFKSTKTFSNIFVCLILKYSVTIMINWRQGYHYSLIALSIESRVLGANSFKLPRVLSGNKCSKMILLFILVSQNWLSPFENLENYGYAVI